MRHGRQLSLTAALALFAGCVLAPAAARAAVTGSPHDLSRTGPFTQSDNIAPAGVCSACHIPHGADTDGLWARNLATYRSNLVNDGAPASVPNYVLPPSIQCYDCHDYHSGSSPNNLPNDIPGIALFGSGHRPQNIAFGFTKLSVGNMTEDPPGGSVSGYYENKPPFASNYGANPALAPTAPPYPTDNSALKRTGGHYFKKTDPTAATGDRFDIGDKLPCRDCHDPHVWSGSWQAFIKPNLGGTTGWSRITPAGSPTASRFMANEFTSLGARSDTYSRTLCIACHGDSNALTPVAFSAISPDYSASAGTIVRPPDWVAEHRSASQIACVSCHPHNSVDASCSDCHGNPPPAYPAGRNPEAVTRYAYPGGANGLEQTHGRHHGFFSDNTARFSPYSYECTVCHANNALHQDNNVNVVYDLSGLGKGNPPSFQPFTGSTYVRATCANVYCHSLGLSDNTVNPILPDNVTVVPYFRSVTWGTAPPGCNGCHGTTTVSGTVRHGMPDYRSGTAGSPSANSHEEHVVGMGYECSVCHFNTAAGTYLTGRTIRPIGPPGDNGANRYHVNGNAGGPGADLVFDVTVATGSYTQDNANAANNKRCAVSCHNSQALPLAQQPQWGGTLNCISCHVSSAADSDQYLLASDAWFQNGVVGTIDNAEWTWSGHGKSTGNYDVSGRPAAALLAGGTGNNPCLYCHDPNVGHRVATNPFRLLRQDNVSGFSGFGWNATCLVCHRKTPAPPGYDPDGAATAYAIQAATAAFVDNAHWGAEHGATNGGKFCWDCHDPHGDRNSAGTGNIFMVHRQQLARLTDNTYGYRGTTGALTTNAPVFTNVTTGTSYADNTTFRGICQVCHTLATTGHYRENFGDGHNEGSRCTTCHVHDAAFAASKCEGCHGGEFGELAPVNGAPKVTRYWKTSGHGRAAGPAVTCENCHDVASPSPSTHTTSGSGTFNTYRWFGNAADNTNANTSHLKAFYVTTGTASQIQVAFDAGCYNGPGGGVACHAQRFIKDHRHTKNPTTNEMRFGRANTTNNPKGYTWYTQGAYDVDFYKSRSPWTIQDATTNAGVPNPPSAPYYGTCVSCHDPHGTGTTDNTAGGLGTTNHMIRGNFLGGSGSQFCNGACHK